jgi:DNA-binding IclR family transcriptional regulator
MANGHAIAALNVTWPSKRVHVEDVVSRHLETLQGIADRIGQAVESN